MERYSEEVVEKLTGHPLVLEITTEGLLLTLEFRKRLYKAWEADKRERVVRQILIAEGLGPKDIGSDKARRLVHQFRYSGEPKLEGRLHKTFEIPENIPRRTMDELVEQGFLIRTARGISVPEWLYQKARSAYPEKEVEEVLIEEGVDPRDLGSIRLSRMRLKARHYSDENLNRLKDHPAIARAEDGALSFTVEFRGELCDIWEAEGNYKALYDHIESCGIEVNSSIKRMVRVAINAYKVCGRPSREWTADASSRRKKDDAPGTKSSQTPDETAGPEDNGQTCQSADGRTAGNEGPEKPAKPMDPYTDGYLLIKMSKRNLELYARNPFVREVERRRIVFNDYFYETARDLEELGIDRILTALNISADNFFGSTRIQIKEAVGKWKPVGKSWPPEDAAAEGLGDLELVILTKLNAAYETLIEREYRLIGERARTMARPDLKELCKWIKGRPRDPGGKFTIRHILSLVGISSNSFYCYNRIERYGLTLDEKDRLDGAYVRQAFEYKGYKKGCRQVTMVLRTVVGKPMGVDKVRRLMKKEGLKCDVREPSPYRSSTAGRAQTCIKPNILRRKFKLYRPNRVRVTDVTYLSYGLTEDGKKRRAYGSALMDPVTGRLIVFNVSESNDLDFVKETLELSKSHPCIDGGIFHSDQGALYQADEFQRMVGEMGFQQSMSRRANCWDNATQESFFGHFKDECAYEACETLEELRACLSDYMYYYNNERGVWGNRRMTPVEYEEYLLSLTDEEFEKYLSYETEKNAKMKAKAAEKAKQRARMLKQMGEADNGNVQSGNEGGQGNDYKWNS